MAEKRARDKDSAAEKDMPAKKKARRAKTISAVLFRAGKTAYDFAVLSEKDSSYRDALLEYLHDETSPEFLPHKRGGDAQWTAYGERKTSNGADNELATGMLRLLGFAAVPSMVLGNVVLLRNLNHLALDGDMTDADFKEIDECYLAYLAEDTEKKKA